MSHNIEDFVVDYVLENPNFKYKLLLSLITDKLKIIISKSSLYSILKKNNITKKRTQIRYIPNLEKIKIASQNFKEKINEIQLNNIISIDESSFDSHMHSSYLWSKKGKSTKIIKLYPKKRYSVICAISNKEIINLKIIDGSVNGEIYLKFIKKLVNKLDLTETKYLLMDNARIHHYKKLKENMENFENLEIIYNVPYSPEYNPIEKLFNETKIHIKKEEIDNSNIITKIKETFYNSQTNLKNIMILH